MSDGPIDAGEAREEERRIFQPVHASSAANGQATQL